MKKDELEEKLKTVRNHEFWKTLFQVAGSAIVTGLVDIGIRNIMAHTVLHNTATEIAKNQKKKEATGVINGAPASNAQTNITHRFCFALQQVAPSNPIPQPSNLTSSATENAGIASVLTYGLLNSNVPESSINSKYYGGNKM